MISVNAIASSGIIVGSNAVATVSWFSSGANDQYRLLFQHSVPANGQVWLPLEAFARNANDQIRVQAGTVIFCKPCCRSGISN